MWWMWILQTTNGRKWCSPANKHAVKTKHKQTYYFRKYTVERATGGGRLSSWCVYRIRLSTGNTVCGLWVPSELKSFKITKQAGHFCLQCSPHSSKGDAFPCKCTVRLQNFDKLCHWSNFYVLKCSKFFYPLMWDLLINLLQITNKI
jgi:hypothetical protein